MDARFVVVADGVVQHLGTLSHRQAYRCAMILEDNGYANIRVLEAIEVDPSHTRIIFDPVLGG